jgi:hypothetical protein
MRAERWWTDERLVAVEPIGKRTVVGFYDGRDERGNDIGGHGPVELPEYPPTPEGELLRQTRVSLGYSLREAAAHMSLRPVELAALERGSLRFLADAEWKAARLALPGAGECMCPAGYIGVCRFCKLTRTRKP